MDSVERRNKNNGFVVGLGWIFWLGVLGFVAYRAILPLPSDPNKLYLVYTKFNGYQEKVLQPNKYYISWQNLLPGNVELLAIPHQVQELYLSKSFGLPSAQSYQVLLPNLLARAANTAPNPFEFQVGLQLRYRYRAEELLAFALNPANSLVPAAANYKGLEATKAEGLQQSAVIELTLQLENKLRQRLNQELQSLVAKVDGAELIASAVALEQYLKNMLIQAFPELELLSLDVYKYQQADLELYTTVRQAYGELLQQLSSQSLSRLLEQQNQRLAQELYLQNIERLGEILSQNPLLIQYFAVTASPLKGLGKGLGENIAQGVLEQIIATD